MKNVSFLTPPDVKYGFSLSGVTQYTSEIDEAEETLKKIMAQSESGLIIIEERLL